MFSKFVAFGAALAAAASFVSAHSQPKHYDYSPSHGNGYSGYESSGYEHRPMYYTSAPPCTKPVKHTMSYTEAPKRTEHNTEIPKYSTEYSSSQPPKYTEAPRSTTVYEATQPQTYSTESPKSNTEYMTTKPPMHTDIYETTQPQKHTQTYKTTKQQVYHTESLKSTTEYKATQPPKQTTGYPRYTTDAPKYTTQEELRNSSPPPTYHTEAPYSTEYMPPRTTQSPRHYTEAQKRTKGYKPNYKRSGKCGKTCRFTFCGMGHGGENKFTIGRINDKPFTPAICDKYGRIRVGSVDSTGEAYVVDKYAKTLISKFYPKGLKQHYSSSFFKSYYVDYSQKSGVGHETPQQNQLLFMDNKCIILPLTAYQSLDKYGNVIEEVHPGGNPFYDCVAFHTEVEKKQY